MLLRNITRKAGQILTGRDSLGRMLSLLKQHIVAVVILLVGVGLLAVVSIAMQGWFRRFALLIERLKWEKISTSTGINCIRKAALFLIIVTVILNLWVFAVGRIKPPVGPNVILLVVDALRVDSLGCYNQDSNETPEIDRFAENSIVFKDFIAQSTCTINSAPSIFFSVYPYEHGYFSYRCVVPCKLNSLAEWLKNQGYRTFGISTNPHVSSNNGLDQGFDIFIEDYLWQDIDCDEVNSKFVKWLDNNMQEPFFAMLWYIDPHEPYDPPHAYIDKYLNDEEKQLVSDRTKCHLVGAQDQKDNCLTLAEKKVAKKLYDGEVNFFDTEFAKLVKDLEQRGLVDDSIIILTSDHGESFWEKKNVVGTEVGGHGVSLYDEEIKVPCIISLPNERIGKVIQQKAQHIDIVPTVLSYTGTDTFDIDRVPMRGSSLKDVINGGVLQRKYFFSQLIKDTPATYRMECVQVGDFKLIKTTQYGGVHFSPAYFELVSLKSAESEIDIAGENAKSEFDDLQEQLLSWPGNLEKATFTTSKRVEYKSKEEEDKILKRLKSLGYVE
jgi:arylsulfatase A-like enzyme